MDTLHTLRLFADYSQWMNQRLYAAAATLPDTAIAEPRGAFFGSLLGTLNHLVVADTIWLQRFAQHPARHPALRAIAAKPVPATLDTSQADCLADLRTQREALDATIAAWMTELQPDDLDVTLCYRNTRGESHCRRFGDLLLHFFNHQTHHRGQATTLLSQAGADVGVTDMLAVIPQVAVG
ncbi:DinB family protein [Xanthomonas sacchari]|uniref:Damage-inducible protein DinB n=1 Tax=Xanthomonas sacchari TaxID=56458 RepID=A0A2P5Z6P3_9XANT|nr:DinB family protein [Xanthomonas sacchari]MDV0438405.1 DinB family protein [Xanthomonas sacchari]PPU83907.1 damage-inducible protein DinB [Xanthomonas sacchari]